MKIILIITAIFLCLTPSWGQDEPKKIEVEDIYDVVEVAPEFKGGMDKLYAYLGKSIKYPKEAINKNIQGKVYVQFVVNKKGKISDVNVVKGAHILLDNEAIRVISMMPKWSPGEQRGKKVNVRYVLPINFTINE